MKILSCLFLFLVSTCSYAADGLEVFPYMQRRYITLEVKLSWNGFRWEHDYRAGITAHPYYEPLTEEKVKPVYQGEDPRLRYFQRMVNDSTFEQIHWSDIYRLYITVDDAPSNAGSLDLSSIITESWELAWVQHIKITQRNASGTKINLEQWPSYKQWKKDKRLTSFEIHSDARPIFNTASLYPFKELERLALPQALGEELLHFPKLKHLSFRGVRTAFTHQVKELEHLVEYSEYKGLYKNQFEPLHAERYFFLRYLPNASHVDTLSSKLSRVGPFRELLEAVQRELYDTWVENGEILVMENDLPSYCPGSVMNDTLLHGTMKNGVPVGLWTFRLAEQYKYNDQNAHHFDFDNTENPKIPKNGEWSLLYANGKKAIEGRFKKGKKQGEWNFYEEDGSLKSTKWFQCDTLIRTVARFEIDHLPCEARIFYFNEEECVQSFQSPSKVFFAYVDLRADNLDRIVIQDDKVGVSTNGKVKYTMRKDANYDAVMRENVIDYLYPEYVGMELPFEY